MKERTKDFLLNLLHESDSSCNLLLSIVNSIHHEFDINDKSYNELIKLQYELIERIINGYTISINCYTVQSCPTKNYLGTSLRKISPIIKEFNEMVYSKEIVGEEFKHIIRIDKRLNDFLNMAYKSKSHLYPSYHEFDEAFSNISSEKLNVISDGLRKNSLITDNSTLTRYIVKRISEDDMGELIIALNDQKGTEININADDLLKSKYSVIKRSVKNKYSKK